MSGMVSELQPMQPARTLWSLPRRALQKALRIIRDGWRRVARNRHCIYVRSRGQQSLPLPRGLRIERYEREQEIPSQWMSQIRSRKGERYLDVMRRELADGGVLWIGVLDGELASFQWSRLGRHTRRWFVPVGPDDVLLFASVTLEKFRGRGIAPAMMSYMIETETPTAGCAYVDCKVWNQPAIRFIEKQGFKRVATMKPLKPEVDS